MSVPIALTRLVTHMQRWLRLGYGPYHLFLSQKAIEQASHKGYLALAQLIQACYFSVIVTTDSHSLLEHGLESVGLEPCVLRLDQDAEEHILQALEDLVVNKIYILKLSQEYEDETAPIAPLSSTLHIAIQRYLSNDLIVVGSVKPHFELLELMQPTESSGTYYCIHEQPSPHDTIVQLLQSKHTSKEDFLICGEHGHFDILFKTIASLLRLPAENRQQASPQERPSPTNPSSRIAELKPNTRHNRETAISGFDVFLCHNEKDKRAVKEIGLQLKERGVSPWFDEWELRPGLPWQQILEQEIAKIKAAAVFVGKDGIGPWQEQEIRAFLQEFVKRQCPVIPVLLSNTSQEPQLPIFLRDMTWVDFRRQDLDPLKRLIWGITGRKT